MAVADRAASIDDEGLRRAVDTPVDRDTVLEIPADRAIGIAEIAELSIEQLSTLLPEDVEFEDTPAEALAPLADEKLKFRIECPKCDHDKDVPQKFLGEKVRCPKCNEEFNAAWGEIAEAKQANDE